MTFAANNYQQLDIEKLIQELTLGEKIQLLAGVDFWHTAAIDRLGIPAVRVSDGPNGVRGTKFFNSVPSNCFPCGTGMASTFNKQLLVEAGQLMGKEAKLKGSHCVLGPTCNIARGPLGGRAFESYSEDPLLSGHAASSVIKGIQSENVLACIKHFVCNDQEDKRNSVDTIVTERALREIYLKPFQLAIRDSHPKSLMTAYNKVNGVHVSQSKKLLHDILRKEWGWDGTVMSDWYGTYSMKESLDAGMNLEMPGPSRFRSKIPLVHKVKTNEIHEDVIDENVRYILKFVNESLKVGIPPGAVESPNNSPEASKTLRKIGSESIVLLKNDNNVLPLSKTSQKGNERIAVIGPNAKVTQDSGGGSASLRASYKITPYDGIKAKIQEGNNTVGLEYTLGAVLDKNLPDVGEILTHGNGKKGIVGKFYKDPPGTKNRESFETLELNSTQLFMADFTSPKLADNMFYADFLGDFVPEESGTYEIGCSTMGTAQIFVNDQLVVDNKSHQTKGDAFFLGLGTREEKGTFDVIKGETYAIRVEFGSGPTYTLRKDHSEKGGVYFGLRKVIKPEEEIGKAVELAKKVDRVVLCVGISKEWESEGFDRPNMDIPGYTDQLVQEVARANPNVIVVNQSGSPISMPWAGSVAAIVQAWYGGNEAGNTIADVLFGDVNPSGKLSMTFPVKLEDNPSFLNFGASYGRVLYGEDVFVGYRFYEKTNKEVLFPFGYGLSYTTFDISGLNVKSEGEIVAISVQVTNTGRIDGAETVQLYIEPETPSVIRPVKELKDFEKVFLKAGESATVNFELSTREATSFWNEYKAKWQSEKGKYHVLVGNSSDNAKLRGAFEVSETVHWLGL